jgi:hypothetical protein
MRHTLKGNNRPERDCVNIRPIRFFLSAVVALLSTSVPVLEAVAESDFCVSGRELYPGDKANGMASNVTFIGWSNQCEGSSCECAWVPRGEKDGYFDLFVQIDYEGKAGYGKSVDITDGLIVARFSDGRRVNLCIDGDADSKVTWPDYNDEGDNHYCGSGVAEVYAVTTICNVANSPSVVFELCLDDRAYLEPKTPVWGPNRAPVVPELWGVVSVLRGS